MPTETRTKEPREQQPGFSLRNILHLLLLAAAMGLTATVGFFVWAAVVIKGGETCL